MKVFVSWSGKTSHVVADALAQWLKLLPFSSIDTWVSGESIDPGTRWNKELSKALESTNLGILCLTKANQLQPWICYEAGALAKMFDKSLVIPYLIDFTAHDLLHPIKQFQAISATKEETWKIVSKLFSLDTDNTRQESDIKEAFKNLWPFLESQIEQAKKNIIEENPENTIDTNASLEKLTSLVESISERLFIYENKRLSLALTDKDTDFLPLEYKKEMAEINKKLDKLNTFDQVSELLRQADFMRNNNPQGAIVIYDKALKIDPCNDAVLIGKAKAYRRLSDWDSAINILDSVIETNPDAERAYYNRACYKNLSKKYPKKEVLQDLCEAINKFDKYCQYAIVDEDFKDLIEDADFKKACNIKKNQ